MNVAHILAIRLGRLGDVTLLLPSLWLLRAGFPGSRLTLLTSMPYAPLAEMCPWVDAVMPLDRLGMRDGPKLRALGEIRSFVRSLRSCRFDLVVDFHSFRETNLMAWISGAPYRLGMRREEASYLRFCFNLPPAPEDKGLHVAEMFRRVALAVPGLGDPGPPVEASIRAPEAPSGSQAPGVALYIGASVPSRRWPAGRFAELAAWLVDRWEVSVRVLSGNTAEEEADAARVVASAARGERVRAAGRLGIAGLVGEIAAAGLLVSNDSGPMHLGSAVGTPTLGLFSDSLPEHYRPVGPADRFLRGVPIGEIGLSQVVGVLGEMRSAMAASP